MTKAEAISKVVAFAESRLGYLEKSASAYNLNHNIVYELTAGAGSDNRCEAWETLKPSYNEGSNAWCQGFVHYCFYKALGEDSAKAVLRLNDWKPTYEKYTAYACASWRENFESHDAKYQSSRAEVGDIIYFKKSHTGLVVGVTADTIYTIEGNTSGASGVIPNGGGVCKKSYVRGSADIRCYGRPDWEAICKDGRDTLFRGYSGEDAVYFQKCMNALGITDECGNRLTIDGSYGNHSVAACVNFQTKYGLTADGYCGSKTWAMIEQALDSPEQKIQATTNLNVRSGAGATYPIVTIIRPGTTYEVNATSGEWLYLGELKGWVSKKYTESV